jgi:putative ABC transport system substrate-binding protein
MRRREFLSALGGTAVAWPLAVHAQQPERMRRIGVLFGGFRAGGIDPFMPMLKLSLNESGYLEGRTVAFEYCIAEGDVSRLPTLAADLVRRNVDVILALAPAAVLAAKAATSTIPIIFVMGADPVGLGFVASMNRPGGSVTGINFFTYELEAKRLGLLHEIVPKVELIAVLLNPTGPTFENQLKDIDEAARALGLKIQIERASSDREIDAAFTSFAQHRVGALLVSADPYFYSLHGAVVARATQYRIPAIYQAREYSEAGGLMSYGTSLSDAFRHAGDYLGRVLRGANPADLPALQSTKFELVINLKTARTLGLEFPPTLLARADEVIE